VRKTRTAVAGNAILAVFAVFAVLVVPFVLSFVLFTRSPAEHRRDLKLN
jgi:hypothetical protein